MNNERDCKHGQLARSCEICGLEAENERLEIVAKAAGATAAEFMRERDALKAELAAMREQKPIGYASSFNGNFDGRTIRTIKYHDESAVYAAPGANHVQG